MFPRFDNEPYQFLMIGTLFNYCKSFSLHSIHSLVKPHDRLYEPLLPLPQMFCTFQMILEMSKQLF